MRYRHWNLALLVVGLLASPVCGATFCVDQNHPQASDVNPGTEALPWKTILKGVTGRAPGDLILVKEGIYRESFSLPVSGALGNPITLRAYAGHRAVLSGADRITGWTQCTQPLAKGNPNWANIYYADIAWKPTRLSQDVADLALARVPAHGAWPCTGGTTNTMVDTVNLTQADDYWNGAILFLHDQSAGATYQRNVSDFDAAARTLTVDAIWYEDRVPEPGADTYYLTNLVQLIDGQGQWVTEDRGGVYRVYAWAYGGGDPDNYLMEGSRRSYCIFFGTRGHWTFDGLEFRHTTVGWGYGLGNTNSGGIGYLTVQNCLFHHNDGYGLQLGYAPYSVVRHNTFVYNRLAVALTVSPNTLVEENEVGWNIEDGVRPCGSGATDAGGNPIWTDNMTVRRNYIHDHIGESHPDNLQTFNYGRNILIEDNFVISGGQNYMCQQADQVTLRNNVVIGSLAVSIIYGSGVSNCTTERNTALYSGYQLFAAPSDGGYYRNNICVQGGSSRIWGVGNVPGYSSDYNCFWVRPGYTSSPVVWNSQWNWTWSQYKTGSGQDAHSYCADPLFVNAPTYFVHTDTARQRDFTATKVYMSTTDASFFAVGDHIEIDWDGVMRTVTAKGSDWIEFTPGDLRFMDKAWQIANWKNKTSTALNLTLQAGSPAKGTAQGGGDMGANLNLDDYRAGDFNGDGVRDVPAWPPQTGPQPGGTLSGWAVAAAHGGAGELACEASEGYVESRAAGIRKVKITFSAALDPATVNNSVLSIVGQASGNQSGRIQAITLQGADKVMVVQLSIALPDADRYALTVSETVKSVGGGYIAGSRARQLSALAGDVDSSGRVSAADILAARGHAGQALAGATARYDADCSGGISGGDVLAIRSRVGNRLP